MTPNDFLKIIVQQKEKSIQPIPSGWYSCGELAEQWNCCKSKVQQNLRQGIEIGIVEKKNFLVKLKELGIRSVPYYFFHDEKKRKSKN